jgi:hypothetical protein
MRLFLELRLLCSPPLQYLWFNPYLGNRYQPEFLSIFAHKSNQGIVNLLGMRSGQEMRSTVHNNKLRRGTMGEQLNLMLCIRNAVHHIFGSLSETHSMSALIRSHAYVSWPSTKNSLKRRSGSTYMKPHDRTPDVEEAPVQAIAVTQVDGGHTSAASAIVALVVGGNDLAPGVSRLLGTVLAEADVDEEVAVFLVWLEIGCQFFAGPFVDWSRAGGDAVPAAEVSRPFRFVV